MLVKREVDPHRNAYDLLGWVLAAVLAIGSLWLPQALDWKSDRGTDQVLVVAGLFISGAIVGSLRRYRVWRWAVAAFLAFAFTDLARLASDPKYTHFETNDMAAFLAANVSVYVIRTVPVLIGAYVGSSLLNEGLR